MSTKICNRCKECKDIECFYQDKSKKDNLKTICIECIKKNYNSEHKSKLSKEYYKNNKEKVKIKKIEYNIQNKEKLKKYRSDYYINNKEYYKNASKKYYNENKNYIIGKYKNKLKTDNIFRFVQNLKSNVRNSLTKYGYTKKSSVYKIIGIEYTEFKKYIENKFKEGMSWQNYGDWQLDHKIPVSWAKDEMEAIKLCHYSNYQPLWKEENLSKGNRYSSNCA